MSEIVSNYLVQQQEEEDTHSCSAGSDNLLSKRLLFKPLAVSLRGIAHNNNLYYRRAKFTTLFKIL